MAFVVKLTSGNLPGAQIAMVRFAVHLIPILLIPPLFRASLHFGRLDLLFYRGFFGGLAVLLYFVTIEHIPVGQATLLNYTAPVFSGMFAALFIGEPLRPRILVPLAVAFVGIALVVRGNATPASPLGMSRWALAGLGSAILSGAAVTALRVARRSEGSWPIFASFSIFGLLATAPFGLWQWRHPHLLDWILLALVGCLSIGAQLTMTHAFRWIETLTAGTVSQLAVVISMVLGAVWLGERPSGLAMIGSLLTFSGVLMVMWVTSLPHPTGFDEAAEQ